MTAVLEMLLADARTPSGGYAHSSGLEALLGEPAWADGGSASTVPEFMRARLATVGLVDAAFAARACECAELEALLALDEEWAARTPAEPLRRAARQLGRGLLRTGSAWFAGDRLLRAYLDGSGLTPRPIALGVLARAGGLAGEAAARASLYDDAATVAAAAVKLLPLDAAEATGWVLALAGDIEALSAAASVDAAHTIVELPSTSTPLLDRRAMTHATTERRLFAS